MTYRHFFILGLLAAASTATVAEESNKVQGESFGVPSDEAKPAAPVPSLEDAAIGQSRPGPRLLAPPSPDSAFPPPVEAAPTMGPRKPKSELERTTDNAYIKMTFGYLGGFDYVLPDPYAPTPPKVPANQLPAEVAALDDEKIVIVGYMMPIEMDSSGAVTSFILVRDQSLCCFGIPPAINEWVGVETKTSGPVKYFTDIPVAVFGTLDVGEELEDGYVISLYRMDADSVTDVRELLRRSK